MIESSVFLKSGKETPVLRMHPWVFSGAVSSITENPEDGSLVKVYTKDKKFLGVGHFHHGSIAVRMLAFTDENPESVEFWRRKLQSAFQARQILGLGKQDETNCYRLVHGEGDCLSGLIIDIYHKTAVVQCHSIGMHRQVKLIQEGLRSIDGLKLEAIYDKSKESLPLQYSGQTENRMLWGDSLMASAMVLENGYKFLVNWVEGQKTGFFLDQRENRSLLNKYSAGKHVLNTFCYTGGFSVYALKAGAAQVDSVDVSAKAMLLTEQNVENNRTFNGLHNGYTGDALKFLQETTARYDIIVLDPPAYAKSIEKRHNAVQAYKRLNIAGMKRLSSGGLLFTFSCSQVVDNQLFYNTIVSAAMELGVHVRVLHRMTQGPDHPVSLAHPEGAYLKGLVLQVE
jgi:23S rRNA (cytosine1962-C5)-methyltransferase